MAEALRVPREEFGLLRKLATVATFAGALAIGTREAKAEAFPGPIDPDPVPPLNVITPLAYPTMADIQDKINTAAPGDRFSFRGSLLLGGSGGWSQGSLEKISLIGGTQTAPVTYIVDRNTWFQGFSNVKGNDEKIFLIDNQSYINLTCMAGSSLENSVAGVHVTGECKGITITGPTFEDVVYGTFIDKHDFTDVQVNPAVILTRATQTGGLNMVRLHHASEDYLNEKSTIFEATQNTAQNLDSYAFDIIKGVFYGEVALTPSEHKLVGNISKESKGLFSPDNYYLVTGSPDLNMSLLEGDDGFEYVAGEVKNIKLPDDANL